MTADRRSTFHMRADVICGFAVVIVEQPSPGSNVGGDVLIFEADPTGGLQFLIAEDGRERTGRVPGLAVDRTRCSTSVDGIGRVAICASRSAALRRVG